MKEDHSLRLALDSVSAAHSVCTSMLLSSISGNDLIKIVQSDGDHLIRLFQNSSTLFHVLKKKIELFLFLLT